ncbi:hypothetical protein KDN32_20790 [Nocardioides sp. J2M5]|uniref:hypothetical protein n=1 Tax=Nocardioides palaemonis TaxID=2829810 RepID=UPI001BA4664C|nr:hypothetical protein [Nocardioides palaemonis]MBS2940181.1 hypothetical protein [Nocardioides palaemonis]
MAAETRMRYEVNVASDIREAPSGQKTLKSIKAGTPTDALQRLVGFNLGSGTATYYVKFKCQPTTPIVAYDGYSANGHQTTSGDTWEGEIEVTPALKRRQATPRFNLLTVPAAVHAKTPAAIQCDVRLKARTTVIQTRERLSKDDHRHWGAFVVNFDVAP